MSKMRPDEPLEGWHPGDFAYCVNARRNDAICEGRIYTVSTVTKIPRIYHSGLTLNEVPTPTGYDGFASLRFIRLLRGRSFLRQIEAARKYSLYPVV